MTYIYEGNLLKGNNQSILPEVTLKPNPKQSLLLECDALHFPDEIGKPDFFFLVDHKMYATQKFPDKFLIFTNSLHYQY